MPITIRAFGGEVFVASGPSVIASALLASILKPIAGMNRPPGCWSRRSNK
jgi:hypothetical protein